jgi:hypothetical protein
MRCPKCNSENPDDSVYCPSCYAVLMKPEAAAASAPEPTQSAPRPAAPRSDSEPRQPAPAKASQLPWRQVSVVVGIAAATLLIVLGGFWFVSLRGSKDAAAPDPAAATAQMALERALVSARAAGGEKVVLEQVSLLTAAPVVAQNVPSQTLGTYAGWVLKKALSVLAESAQDCEVSVQATLHSDDAPSFEVSASQGRPEAALLQRLRQELETLEALHTSARDVSFSARFAVKSGAAAAAEPDRSRKDKFDLDTVRQACSVEIGMFCNAQQSKPAALLGCLRGHSHDLLGACRQSLSIPPSPPNE